MKKTVRHHLFDVLVAFEGMAFGLSIGLVLGAVIRYYANIPPYSVIEWIIIAVIFLIGITKPVTTEKSKNEKR